MSLDKVFHQNLMKYLVSDPCEVRYWDGEVVNYGGGEAQFRIDIKEPIAKSELISDPSLAFGEGYMQKKIDIEGNVQKVIESLYNNQDSFLNQKNMYLKLAKFVLAYDP